MISDINKLQRKLLWGAKEEEKEIMLGKLASNMWSKGVWRFVSEKDSLWARVLKGRADQGEDIMRNRWTSSWWKEVREVCSNDYHQDWFWKALQRRVGNGENALFWKDVGLRQEEIGTRYSRLLAVSSQANCRINEVGR